MLPTANAVHENVTPLKDRARISGIPRRDSETRADLFPRGDHHEKVSGTSKFINAPIDLLSMRPPPLLSSKEIRS
jgi:hypothetical protein